MIHEYALEPELVASWYDPRKFQFFIREFSSEARRSDTGRVISRYPEQWEELVKDAFDSAFPGTPPSEMEKKRLNRMLRQLKARMVNRPQSVWDDKKDWLANVEDEHIRWPFHAVLARENLCQREHVMCEDDILDDKAKDWEAPSTVIVQRYANKMAECVAPMLRCATIILFVDPYFRANHDQERYRDRHKKTLAAFLQTVGTRASQIKIELHTATQDKTPDWEAFRQECEEHLPSILPLGATLIVHRWKNRVEKLHNRYILTDIGGVLFGAGLDEGAPGATDYVVRLNRDVYSQRLRDYTGPNLAFERDGKPFPITRKK